MYRLWSKCVPMNLKRAPMTIKIKLTHSFGPLSITFSLRLWTLLHVLNNRTVSLNQGRYTWRHNSIWKVSLSLQTTTSPCLVTSADTRILEVPSQLTSLFLSSSLTWSFTTKRTILYAWLSWQCHLKITSRKLTIVMLRNVETLFLIFWIMDSPVIWLVFNWILWPHYPWKHQEHWQNLLFCYYQAI